MTTTTRHLWPQPIVAAVVSSLALAALGGAWLYSGTAGVSARDLLLALALIAAVPLSYHFPIHLSRSHKIEVTSIPLYLMAALLPTAPLAATAAGLGILAGELHVRRERGNLPADIATATSRWVIVMLCGSLVAHLSPGYSAPLLVAAAFVLWAGDTLTCPLVIAPMRGDRPLRVLFSNTYLSLLAEGAQYLLGLLGVVAASTHLWALALLVLPMVLINIAFRSATDMQSSTLLMLESMADIVDLRDPYTGGHSRRVAAFTERILGEVGLQGVEADLIVMAARVHDIGKIGVPDYVLNKAGRLTLEEEALMQTHPDRGADLLLRYRDFRRGVEIVRHHHESWDGTGYPKGLKATEIPFGARVIAVADSFDAMTSDRPYRQAMSLEKATSILLNGRNQQWDASIVDAFLRTLDPPDAAPCTPEPAPQTVTREAPALVAAR